MNKLRPPDFPGRNLPGRIRRGILQKIRTGIGIPEKSLPEIWNKFYRVPHGNRTDVRGYGIGLFYVKSIIDKHGWSIGVESKSGKGSKFTIKFSNQ